jgi:hypothetical protein
MKEQASYKVDVSAAFAGLCTRRSTNVSRETTRRVPSFYCPYKLGPWIELEGSETAPAASDDPGRPGSPSPDYLQLHWNFEVAEEWGIPDKNPGLLPARPEGLDSELTPSKGPRAVLARVDSDRARGARGPLEARAPFAWLDAGTLIERNNKQPTSYPMYSVVSN